jgi:2-methylcitrate dehydratase PrpD
VRLRLSLKGARQLSNDVAIGRLTRENRPSGYLDKLASFVASADYQGLPSPVIDYTKVVLLDTLGVILTGSKQSEMANLSRFLLSMGKTEASTVFRPGFPRAEPSTAALINATASAFPVLDESHPATGHHAVQIVPSTLALAESRSTSGKRLLESIVLGYEMAVRIASACRRRKGFHPHGHTGIVGTAVACAKLMGLDQRKIKETINVSASLALASSMKAQLEGATVTNLYAGLSACLGMLAPQLVEDGFTGPSDGLKETFGKLIGQNFSPDESVKDLGKTYQITCNTLRVYACCGHTHPAVDGIRAILEKKPLSDEEIAKIDVFTYREAASLKDHHPGNPQAAKFSIPFTVATMVVRGSCGLDAFQPRVVADQGIHRLAERVHVFEDPALTQRWPEDCSARVVVTLEGGETLTEFCENSRGKRRNPLSAKDMEEKFKGLAASFFPVSNMPRVVEAIKSVDKFNNIRDFTALLRDLGLKV